MSVASFLLCQVVALSLSQLTIINFTTLTSISRDGTMISLLFFFFFLRMLQPMTFTPNNSSLLSNQDTNQFLV